MLDFHNHLIPAVDDGAGSIGPSRDALHAMAAQGVDQIICSPHFEASLTRNPHAFGPRMAAIDRGWTELHALAEAEFPALRVERGVELMLDIPDPDLSDPRIRLAGTNFVLIEFPMMSVPPNSAHALQQLVDAGWHVILGHPERYYGLAQRLELAAEWRAAGAFLQVNAGSLIGRYGPEPKRLARHILERGLASYIASDFHARGPLLLESARMEIVEAGGEEQARRLLDVNPARVLTGQVPQAVPAVRWSAPGDRWMDRIRRAFR